MPDRAFERLPESNNLLVDGAARRRLAMDVHGLLVPENPVLLHFARRHLGEAKLAEIPDEVSFQPAAMMFT